VSGAPCAERNGWRLFRHPAFRRTLDALNADVQRVMAQRPEDWQSHPKAKLLRRIVDLIEVEIPRNPGAPEYAQGHTLGPSYRHWRRAKFMSRFRLFFRFDSASRMIVYGWVNDENSLRKAGSCTDPYAVFRHRLEIGDPPDDWHVLLTEAGEERPKKD